MKIQQLFNNCINFFTSEGFFDFFYKFFFQGLKSLLNRVESVTVEIFSEITLIKEINGNEMRLILKKFKSNMDNTTGLKNFSEIIVPISTVCSYIKYT